MTAITYTCLLIVAKDRGQSIGDFGKPHFLDPASIAISQFSIVEKINKID
jgi:hypothetical protein